jgi:hypothetical protein
MLTLVGLKRIEEDDLPATGIRLLGPGRGPALDGTGTGRGEVLIEHQAVPVTEKKKVSQNKIKNSMY